ncbi:formyl-CoA transferase domain protein [Bordetella holmesii 30539]|uniref:Formyl-CoA transferase domain protein n=1 Tax=Bordetella holmesii 1058 TaxID=1247648 RepID=A0ABN0RXX6_9BORD|nr:formyl-CoA transferase domain protein [Bordetella holmesii ATCC 51541]EWM40907.1 formyl-CoA transferase domain protein [Bordetella holmesii 35009]EWM42613.1 formyl-CoA transferase domain protein [Bordetella holmesii 41130]EWM44801.1 formyl-CoA transferase domain protein [Bordetella holmesii 70147]EXF88131.1 formyl-CoA transferase domain protein [Bordetella holmesii 30539]EXX94133.1 formyl-CoA transferase domain protein [Bordetella holmesii 1058]
MTHAWVAHGTDRPHVVARWQLDFDDVCSKITQNLSGIRSHDDRAQIEDADSCQWTCCGVWRH